jgi:hypothetical protein
MKHPLTAALVVLAGTSASLGQDSVAASPGGNDALSSFEVSQQRARYVIDAAPLLTSWGNPIRVAPVLKASRDLDPMFRTQILGSAAISPSFATGVSFAPTSYALWNAPGVGVHPTANTPSAGISVSGFDRQFGVAISDFSLAPTSVVTATVGRTAGNPDRFFVERTVAASSRASAAGADTSTLALGGVDAFGAVALRADAFTALTTTAARLLGDNVVRVAPASRNPALVNTLSASGAVNTSADTAATTYVIANEATPTNTPALLNQPGVGSFALAFDFSSRFRTGSSTANLASTTGQMPAGVVGTRGNPSVSTVTNLGGNATVAALAVATGEVQPQRLLAFGVAYGSAGAPPSVVAGSPRSYLLPSPLLDQSGVNVNPSGSARFLQYQSQTAFRGGNGPVAIGTDARGQFYLAAVATEPSVGEYLALLRVTTTNTITWLVPARSGQAVLDGLTGQSVGTIPAGANFSAPAIDNSGNIFFIASYQPLAGPATTGLFRAVNSAAGYRLELVLQAGQSVTGVNSTRTYTITSLTLRDSDSIASGSMFSSSILPEPDPAASGRLAYSIRRFGAVVASAVITYQNGPSTEAYDALLLVTPAGGTDCDADFNRSAQANIDDIFIFLNGWFAGDPRCDYNNDAVVNIDDIFIFLNIWFQGC